MPIYTGKSSDGSDITQVSGVYVNPNNPDEWCNLPYPSQRKQVNMDKELQLYMNTKYSLDDVYNQIKEYKSPLSRRLRNYVLSLYDNFY